MSTAQPNPSFREQHLTVAQIAELWQLDDKTVRALFLEEDGVLVIQNPRRRTRTYKTLRIPESVARRVYERLTLGRVL